MDHVVFYIPIVAIAGGFLIAGLAIYAHVRRREFEHRERLAMIEKGIAPSPPPPEGDQLRRDPTLGGVLPTTSDVVGSEAGVRLRRGGFIVMAIGLGLGFMIWMTSHEGHDALGLGGFLMILGAAIFLSSYFDRRQDAPGSTTAPPQSPRR